MYLLSNLRTFCLISYTDSVKYGTKVKGGATELDEFLEKCQRGAGESFSIQKFILQILGT